MVSERLQINIDLDVLEQGYLVQIKWLSLTKTSRGSTLACRPIVFLIFYIFLRKSISVSDAVKLANASSLLIRKLTAEQQRVIHVQTRIENQKQRASKYANQPLHFWAPL